MPNDFCILQIARAYLCDRSAMSPDLLSRRDISLVISSPAETVLCWVSSAILSQSSTMLTEGITKEHVVQLDEDNIREMLLILYSLHCQWWKRPYEARIQGGLDAVSKHTLNHISTKYQLMPAIIPFMAFIYKTQSIDWRFDVEALELALAEGWQTRSQEFQTISAICIQYLRPDTDVPRLGNAYIPHSLPERIEKEIRLTKQKILSLLETARHKLKGNRCSYEMNNGLTSEWLYNIGSRERIIAYKCKCCCPLFRAEYYCDDYLALMQQSWYNKSVADIIECFQRRASDLKKLHKCAAEVYCPLVQVVFWLMNESYIIQKSHHGLSLYSFED